MRSGPSSDSGSPSAPTAEPRLIAPWLARVRPWSSTSSCSSGSRVPARTRSSRPSSRPSKIEGVESLNIGRSRIPAHHGYTHALIVRLRDEDALERYLSHPLRTSYIAEQLQPLEEERIELSVPVDKTLSRDPRRDWEWGASIGMGPPLDD